MVASGGRKEEPGMLFGVSSSKLGLWGLVIMSEPQEQADQPAKDKRGSQGLNHCPWPRISSHGCMCGCPLLPTHAYITQGSTWSNVRVS